MAKQGVVYVEPRASNWRQEARWEIPGVSYRGNVGKYAILKKMTPPLIQEKLAELYEKEKQAGNPRPTDAPLLWANISQACKIGGDTKNLIASLQKGIRGWSNTLSQAVYSPLRDRAVHNANTSDEYTIQGRLVGPDGFIKDIPDKHILEMILENKNVEEIDNVSQKVNSTLMYLWRVNSKSGEEVSKVVVFYADSDRLYLNFSRYLCNQIPAFRVLQIE